jgi:hypothetical protein
MASQLAGFAYRPMRPIGRPKAEAQEPPARPAINRKAVEAVKTAKPKRKKPKSR